MWVKVIQPFATSVLSIMPSCGGKVAKRCALRKLGKMQLSFPHQRNDMERVFRGNHILLLSVWPYPYLCAPSVAHNQEVLMVKNYLWCVCVCVVCVCVCRVCVCVVCVCVCMCVCVCLRCVCVCMCVCVCLCVCVCVCVYVGVYVAPG